MQHLDEAAVLVVPVHLNVVTLKMKCRPKCLMLIGCSRLAAGHTLMCDGGHRCVGHNASGLQQ